MSRLADLEAEVEQLRNALVACREEAKMGLGPDSQSSVCRDERFRRIIRATEAEGGDK